MATPSAGWIRRVRVVGAAVFGIAAAATAVGALAAPVAAPDRLRVQSIAIAPDGPATHIELQLSRRAAQYSLFTLEHPDRVVIDIAAAAMGRTALPLPVGGGAVRKVRAAHRPGGSLRIVFDVAAAVKPVVDQKIDGGNSRLLIDLRPASALAAAPVAPAAPPAVARAPAPETAPAAAPVVLPPAPERAEPQRPLVVVVDAGHGGYDPGAHGPSGTLEKDVTLAISRRLVAQLNAVPGMQGVLTRSGDRYLGLRERMEKARSANADLFISVHADAAQNHSAQGSTVYVLSGKAASDEASRRLAARENAALIGGVELGDKDPVLASVLMDLSQNASISSSIAVGNSILRQMDKLGRLHRQSVQQAPFMVLKSPDVPSVLVETAYISNRIDERNLRSPEHQDLLAAAILGGVRHYFEANPPNGRPASMMASHPAPSPTRVVIQRGDTLSDIASRYNISVAKLRAANALDSDTVRVGQTLRIPATL